MAFILIGSILQDGTYNPNPPDLILSVGCDLNTIRQWVVTFDREIGHAAALSDSLGVSTDQCQSHRFSSRCDTSSGP